MQAHLAGIDGGEEIPPREDGQHQGAGDEDAESGQHGPAVIERPVQQPGVGRPHHLESPVEEVMHAPDDALAARRFAVRAERVELHLRLQHEVHHVGNQGAREQVGRQHGESWGIFTREFFTKRNMNAVQLFIIRGSRPLMKCLQLFKKT